MKMKYPRTLEQEAPVLERRKKSKRDSRSVSIYTDQKITVGQEPSMPVAEDDASRLSTFNIIMLLVIAAFVITAYISNIIQVDALMLEYTKLERQESHLLQKRENLRADINSLSSYNRIQKIATEKLGLVHARQQAFKLEIHQ